MTLDPYHYFAMRPALSRKSCEVGQIYLTRRETQTLDALVRGLTRKEIARAMRLSPRTTELYMKALREKTGARSTHQLIAIAVRSGWTP
jgi:DNA-binding NarL/FixJ family response regulator